VGCPDVGARSSASRITPSTNLVVFLDGNQIQLDNFVKKVLDIEPVIRSGRPSAGR